MQVSTHGPLVFEGLFEADEFPFYLRPVVRVPGVTNGGLRILFFPDVNVYDALFVFARNVVPLPRWGVEPKFQGGGGSLCGI